VPGALEENQGFVRVREIRWSRRSRSVLVSNGARRIKAMRIALISDIHGNLVALEAALADIQRRGADRIICLGDVALDGPQPRQVIERLGKLEIPTILGNTDHWLLNPLPKPVENEQDKRDMEAAAWVADQLSSGDRVDIIDFAPTLSFDFGDGFTLLCYHGSPRSYNDRIEPTTPEEELDKWFAEERALINAGGHTHEPMIRRYGSSTLVNPGSVGLPIIKPFGGEAINPTWAEYALLERYEGGLSIALRRVPYSLDALTAAARVSDIPRVDEWLADWREAPV
jgi:predicted phosphodiesterase